jgi:hypothetical protein
MISWPDARAPREFRSVFLTMFSAPWWWGGGVTGRPSGPWGEISETYLKKL